MLSEAEYKFEYGAILKGSQTVFIAVICPSAFEYGAILKGSQTWKHNHTLRRRFEYGAILKHPSEKYLWYYSLSMVQF